MDQIKFKAGEFRSFTATRSFALGANVRIENGTDLEFDGSTVHYVGAQYAFPQLRSAITAGWIVLADSYDADNSEYGRPLTANIQVRAATPQSDQPKSMIATVEEDEQIVMNYKSHASDTKAANRRTASQAGSDGVSVRTLKIPAVSTTNMSQAQSVLSGLDNVKITPGQGITVDQMLERMTDEERETYLIKREASRSAYSADLDAKSGSGRVVGRVKSAPATKESEGMMVTVTTGGGIETWDSGNASVVATIAKTSSTVEDGITFASTAPVAKPVKKQVAAKAAPVVPPMSIEIRLKIAKALCPDFPDSYDFGAPTKKKLARLQADFEDNFSVLQAVFAAESDDVKSQLVQEFPQAFA